MERNINYTLVGLFVILTTILLLFFVVWLGSNKYKKDVKYFVIKFRESVSGLNIGSDVKYKGVKIGSVDNLYICKKDPSIITVIVKIQKDVPIKEDAMASLSYKGITGLAYIEIKGGSKNARELPAKTVPPYPEIKTKPSIIARLDTTLTILSNKAEMLVENLNYLLSKRNVNKLMETIKNTNLVIKNIADHNNQISDIIKNLELTSKKLPDSLDNINKNLNTISLKIKLLLEKINKDEQNIVNILSNSTNKVTNSTILTMEQFQKTLKDISNTSKELRYLIETIQDRPSKIIYEDMFVKPGPGE